MNENVRISIEFSLKFVPKGPINNILALVQIMAWRRPGDKPLSEPVRVSLLTHICVVRPQWVKSENTVQNTAWNCAFLFQTVSCVHSCVHGVPQESVLEPLLYPLLYDLWPWHISSRPFSHDFAIKLLNYDTSFRVRSTVCAVMDGFFPYLAQMITSMRGCVLGNDLWPWPLSPRVFGHDFVIKLLKYGASCRARSTILGEFFPYLVLDHWHEWVCCTQWPLTLTYILKVI